MSKYQTPRIVVIGGGTGLPVLLRGIKKYNVKITAIVTVADDGGSSGIIRQELEVPPPGDVRNVLAALSDVEPLVEKLFQHRFSTGDGLSGHTLGNLLLAGMTDITGDFRHAIRELSRVLNVKGRVLPAANSSVVLHGEMTDGSIVSGESKIPLANKKIKRVFLTPEDIAPLDETIREINRADIVLIGPGSLYTSILPNLLVKGIGEAVTACSAKKIYICNVMTQRGETIGYTAGDHVEALINHIPGLTLDAMIVNKEEISKPWLAKYATENAEPVHLDYEKINELNVPLIEDDLIFYDEHVLRHDTLKLAKIIFSQLKH